MQKMHCSIFINAPVNVVWDTMLDDAAFRQWTSVFAEGSHFEGSWEEGSKILFLAPDPKTGEQGGMVSRIKENRHHEFISIEHYGVINNGVEDTQSEEAKKWAPAYENYSLKEKDGGTQLDIEMDIEEEYKEMFEKMWPKALKILKDIAEEKASTEK